MSRCPWRSCASATITARDKSQIVPLRWKACRAVQAAFGGYSLTTRIRFQSQDAIMPCFTRKRSIPSASTRMVAPPASRAALWLAKSMPLAYPDTTVTPRLESCQAQSCAALMPLILALRDPTMPTAGVRSRPALPRVRSSRAVAVVILSTLIVILILGVRQAQLAFIAARNHGRQMNHRPQIRLALPSAYILFAHTFHVFLQDRFVEDRGGRKVRPD